MHVFSPRLQAWERLEKAEHERELALRNELIRQEKLEQLARRFDRKAAMRETWLSENQRLVSQVLLSEIVCVTKMIPMSNYRIQFLQREYFPPMPHILLNLCIFIFVVCVCKCIFSVYVYVLYVPSLMYLECSKSVSLYSGDTDVEISTHSQDFLYLSILVASVELAQVFYFVILEMNLKKFKSPSLILMATMILPPKVVNDISGFYQWFSGYQRYIWFYLKGPFRAF